MLYKSPFIFRLCLLAIAAMSMPVAAVAGSGQSSRSTAAIVKIEHAWIRASMCGNTAFLNHLLADDYRDLSYSSAGAAPSVSGKAESLNSTAHGHASSDCADHGPHQEGLRVQIHGDTAVATGTGVVAARKNRPEIRFHFLDVYAWRKGRWQAVFSEDIRL